MPWVKMDDGYRHHPKILAAGPLAMALDVAGMGYCAENLTDGFVPFSALITLINFERVWDASYVAGSQGDIGWTARETARVLVQVGRWIEVEGGFEIHDYLIYNPSRAAVLADRERERGKKRLQRKMSRGPSPDVSLGDTNGDYRRESLGESDRPVPVPLPQSQSQHRSRAGSSTVRDLFDYWRDRCNHPTAKLGADRRGKIQARLNEGYTAEQIRRAIDGAARGAFVNDDGKRFDDIELICRRGNKLEDFMERASAPAKGAEYVSPETQARLDARLAQLAAENTTREEGNDGQDADR
jgi:hypothetical protein